MYNEYFKIKEVCNLLNVTQTSMSRWIKSGKFPYKIEGITYRIKKIDVLYYLIEGEFPDGQSISKISLQDRQERKALKSFNKTDYKKMIEEYYTGFGVMKYKHKMQMNDDCLLRIIFDLLDIRVRYFEYGGEVRKWITNRDFELFSFHYNRCNPF